MPIQVDINRGREIAERLCQAFRTTGIHSSAPEREERPPGGVDEGSLEHMLFIMLTTAIDCMRDPCLVWDRARQAFEDADMRYLFDPGALHGRGQAQVRQDLQTHGLSRWPNKDARIWHTIGVTLHEKWDGDPRRFLEDCGWDAPTVLERLKADSHDENGEPKSDFPNLRGDKIGKLWLRRLRDNMGIAGLRGLRGVPIPVDVHVARATLTTGAVRGEYEGPLQGIFPEIRHAWFDSVRGLQADGRPMIALDVVKPLWRLSKYGCTDRTGQGPCEHLDRCEARKFCTAGWVIVQGKHVEVRT